VRACAVGGGHASKVRQRFVPVSKTDTGATSVAFALFRRVMKKGNSRCSRK
jgi:hypothetical protein